MSKTSQSAKPNHAVQAQRVPDHVLAARFQAIPKTIGMVVVAAFAARGVWNPPTAASTATGGERASAASAGNRSNRHLRPAEFDRHIAALDIPGLRDGLAAATTRTESSADLELMNPTTGIAS